MKLSTKLSLGLGFLFIIIFSVGIIGSYYIQKLANDSENILEDNYDTIVYAKNMTLSLDEMRSSIEDIYSNPAHDKKFTDNSWLNFEAKRIEFEKNMNAESHNITEIHEKDYVNTLMSDYNLYLNLIETMKKRRRWKRCLFQRVSPSE